jgi:hypothetical protein
VPGFSARTNSPKRRLAPALRTRDTRIVRSSTLAPGRRRNFSKAPGVCSARWRRDQRDCRLFKTG